MAQTVITRVASPEPARPDTIRGHIAARIDRLPLTRVQWQLAILVQITWGFIIFDTDGIGARLYPFVWRPNHIITVFQYSVIQALQVGLGILLRLPDELGRRSPRAPTGNSAGDIAGQPVYLAVRVRHQFLGDGLPLDP